MKKTEIRWISRDSTGGYEIWNKKPKRGTGKNDDEWVGRKNIGDGFIASACNLNHYAQIYLKYNGLAKVTIERLY